MKDFFESLSGYVFVGLSSKLNYCSNFKNIFIYPSVLILKESNGGKQNE